MKKSIFYMLILCGMLLMSTFFVGEMLQKNIYKLIALNENKQIELMSYQKSFFVAKMQVKVSIPIENEAPLVFFIDSDIKHYPHKATKINHIAFVDPDLKDRLSHFFNHHVWLFSREEMSLFGKLSGTIDILEGKFKGPTNSFYSTPFHLSYQYDLNNASGLLDIDWSGFNWATDSTIFEVKGIQVHSLFSPVKQTDFIDYQYNIDVESAEWETLTSHFIAKYGVFKGHSKVAADKLTLGTQNDFKVGEYSSGLQLYSDNQLNLALSGVDLEALSALNAAAEDPALIQQSLDNLFKHGAHIHLKSVHSATPWGDIAGQMDMLLQPGANLMEVVANPLNLIDYMDGDIGLRVPESLLQLPSIGPYLQIALDNQLLQHEGESLSLKSSLDRGELVVNGIVIPM